MATLTTDIDVTTSDVFTISGTDADITVVQKLLGQASFMIETISGVPFKVAERETDVSVSDAAWIKKATVFQTLWLIGQVDSLERQGVSSVSQDGLSISAPDSLTFVLAPLAKRALKNCSWAKNGTLKVQAPSEEPAESPLVSDNHPWYPIVGV